MSSLAQRSHILALFDEAISAGARQHRACEVIDIDPGTLRRWRPAGQTKVHSDARPEAERPLPSNSYSEAERAHILETCNSKEYESLPPSQIVPQLADEGLYIGSESTFYRVLKAADQQHTRGRAKSRQKSRAPTTHTADGPNQVWMMDVTWLPSRVRGQFFYLYMVEDLYSRFGVHWEVFSEENSEHTCRVIEQSMWREKCLLKPPVLHRDNGSVLKSQTVNAKIQMLGLTSSHSRPRVSNDNAYIESMFRTLKYCPRWPSEGFESLEEAQVWTGEFMQWYNHEHRHSGIKFVTPSQRHTGEDEGILIKRDGVYQAAKANRPDRWARNTRNWGHEKAVALNPEKKVEAVT